MTLSGGEIDGEVTVGEVRGVSTDGVSTGAPVPGSVGVMLAGGTRVGPAQAERISQNRMMMVAVRGL